MVAQRGKTDERAARSGPRRLRRRALAIGLVAVVALLVWRRNELVAPLALRIAHGPLERATGLDLAVRRFSGDWLGHLALEGVRARAVDAPVHESVPLRDLQAERVALRYDLLRLLRGDLGGLVEVTGADVAVELDLTRTAGDTGPPDDASAPFELPEGLLSAPPRIALEKVDLDVLLAPGTRLAVDDLSLAGAGAPRFVLEAAAGELVLETPDRRFTVPSPSLAGGIEAGRFDLALDVLSRPIRAEGSLPATTGGDGRLAVRLALDAAEVERDAPFVAALLGTTLADGAWSGRLSCAAVLDVPLDGPGGGTGGDAGGDARELTGELTVGGAALVLDGVALESLDARVLLAGNRLEQGSLEISGEGNRLAVTGLSLPLDAPDGAALLAGTRAALAVELTDVPALVTRLEEDAEAERRPPIGEHRVALAARLADGVLTIDGGTLDYAGGHADVRRGSLPLRLADDGLAADALDVELDVSLDDVAALGALVEQDGWHGALEGEVVLRGTLDAPRGRARLSGHDLALADLALGELALVADADGAEVVLEELALDGPLGRLDARGRYDVAAGRVVDLHATGSTGPALDAAQPALVALAGGALAFELDVAGAHERLAGRPPGDVAFDAAWSAPELAGALAGTLGTEGPLRLRLDEASLAFGEDGLALERPVEVVLGPAVAIEDLLLASRDGGTLRAGFAQDERRLAVDAELVDFAPPAALTSRLPTGFVVGPISGRIRVDRTADALTGEVEIAPLDVELAGWPAARLALRAAAADGRVDLARLALEGDGFALELAGGLPFDPARPLELPDGPLAAQGTLRVDDVAGFAGPLAPALPADVALDGGSAAARIALEGTTAAPRGGIVLDVHRLALVLGQHEEAQRFVTTASGELELGAASIALVRGSLSVHGDALTGTFAGSLGRPLDLTALGAGAWDARDAPLEARLALDARDLSALAPLSGTIRTLSGTARLSAEIAGTPAAPEPRGTLRIQGGALRTSTALPAISGLEAELDLDASGIRVAGVTGELGGAPFRLNGTLVPWGEEPSIDLVLAGEDLLLYRLDGVRVRADAEDVKLTGALAAPLVSGTIALRDGRFVKDFDILPRDGLRGGPRRPGRAQRGLQLFSLGPPLDAWTFDLAVRSETPFEIDNNLTKGALRPELRLTGTGAVPLPDGTIYLDPTRVSLPSGTLRVQSGTIVFDDANPFLPTLEIQSEMRLYGYDITLLIEGPYDRPEVTISSVPALSDEKLLLMVLTGAQPDEDGDVSATAQDVAVYFARDLLGRLTGDASTADDESLLDRVEVVVGGDVTRSGSQTTRGSLRIGDDVWVEDDQLFLTAEKDVYDKINFGLRILFRFP